MATSAKSRRADKVSEDKETSISATFTKAFTSEAAWSDKVYSNVNSWELWFGPSFGK